MVRLRAVTEVDVAALVLIRSADAVAARWGATDIEDSVREGIEDPDVEVLVIEHEGAAVGSIQWAEEEDPDYAHASVDIFLDPSVHGRGLGTDSIRTLVRHLFDDRGHHRITIDPAADNHDAIRCYERVGFRRVGIMRRYERIDDGEFHDALLMDLLAEEFDPGREEG